MFTDGDVITAVARDNDDGEVGDRGRTKQCVTCIGSASTDKTTITNDFMAAICL